MPALSYVGRNLLRPVLGGIWKEGRWRNSVWSMLEQRHHQAVEEVTNPGGLSGGSDVSTGPRDLILICIYFFFFCGASPPDGRQVHRNDQIFHISALSAGTDLAKRKGQCWSNQLT